MENALNDWYSSESKSYEKFAKSHPIQADIESQKEKIKAMTHWCQKENITQTPTIYINNYELPVEYKVDDLIELV